MAPLFYAEWNLFDAAFNRDFLDAVRQGHAAGQTVDEIAASWTLPARYDDYASPDASALVRNVQVIVDELDGR